MKQTPGYRRPLARCASARAFAAALLVLCCGCHRPVDEGLFQRAQLLCQRGQWDEALPLLKLYLLDHPRNAAAHFFLGRCYLLGRRPYFGAAEGEFNVALNLFIQNGRRSPIEGFSDTYFELRCHLEVAKVYLSVLGYALAVGAAPHAIHEILAKCRRAGENARHVAPDAKEVDELEAHLEQLMRKYVGPAPVQKPKRPFST